MCKTKIAFRIDMTNLLVTLRVEFHKILQQHLGHPPTPQQDEVLGMLSHFVERLDSQSCFILKGYAGTGKTTIISALTRSLSHIRKKSVLLAPTGRAAKVMSAYSQKTAFTIHKKIYRKKNAATLDQNYVLADNLHKDTLFIIDEASMISDESLSFFSSGLLHDLLHYVKSGQRCSLLFVGDSAQLPPVGLLESPALNKEYLSNKYDINSELYELTDVIRQDKQSGILFNATRIRQKIRLENTDQHYAFPKLSIQNFPDVFRMNGDRLIEGLHYGYDTFGMEETIVICRSNKSANLYNKHIRHQILFREEEITGGDLIMVVRNNYYWQQADNPENTGFIANGDMATVRKVSHIHEEHGFRFADLTLEFQEPDNPVLTCRVILDSLHSESANLSQEDFTKLYESILLDYEHIPLKKDRFAALKQDPYYNALQIKFAYAITCHKAQGGQWPAVFIDQGYLNDERLNTEFMRWLYTGITRATKQLFFVNFNEKFYQ